MEENIKQERTAPEKAEQSAVPDEAQTAPGQDIAEQAESREDFQSLIRGKYREEYLRHAAALLAEQAEQTNRYLAYRELQRQAEALRQSYPDFDLNRELEDPVFVRLIRNQVDLAAAYEVVHRRELAEAEARRERMRKHPPENGLSRAASPAILQADPRALSREERKQLRRRAAKGEEIVW